MNPLFAFSTLLVIIQISSVSLLSHNISNLKSPHLFILFSRGSCVIPLTILVNLSVSIIDVLSSKPFVGHPPLACLKALSPDPKILKKSVGNVVKDLTRGFFT